MKIDYFFYDNFTDKKTSNIIKKKFKIRNIKTICKLSNPSENKIINHIQNYDDVCMVYFTSGSTGTPKGTKLSHYNYIKDFFFKKNICMMTKLKNIFLVITMKHLLAFFMISISCSFFWICVKSCKNLF